MEVWNIDGKDVVLDPCDHFVIDIQCFRACERFIFILFPYLADPDFEFAMGFPVSKRVWALVPFRAVFLEMEMLVDVFIKEFKYSGHLIDDFSCFNGGVDAIHRVDDAAVLFVDGRVSGLVGIIPME